MTFPEFYSYAVGILGLAAACVSVAVGGTIAALFILNAKDADIRTVALIAGGFSFGVGIIVATVFLGFAKWMLT